MSAPRLILATIGTAVVCSTATSAEAVTAPTRLVGTVGPGFVITLKKNGVTVRRLKAGRYRIRVTDRSDVHDFWLKGPIRRNLTGVSFEGTRTVTLTLPRGSYIYYCAIHPRMKATFRVV